jgi:hypothetical protein
LWESADQPEARWHASGDGPVHYFADTPDGAWAEFVRHEEITDPEDLATVRRNLWAVEITNPPSAQPTLPAQTLTGPRRTYDECQREARRLRAAGEPGLLAPSAALMPGEARGLVVDRGLQLGPARDGRVAVLFGPRPDVVGWLAAEQARPPDLLLGKVRQF